MNDRPDFEALLDALIDKVYARDGWGDQRVAVVAAHHEACLRAAEDAHAAAMRACAAELAELKGLYGAAKATITTLSWAKADAVNLAAELAAERKRCREWELHHDDQVRIKRDLHDKYTAERQRAEGLRAALEPFALASTEGVVKAATGYVTITTCAEYFHRARAALESPR